MGSMDKQKAAFLARKRQEVQTRREKRLADAEIPDEFPEIGTDVVALVSFQDERELGRKGIPMYVIPMQVSEKGELVGWAVTLPGMILTMAGPDGKPVSQHAPFALPVMGYVYTEDPAKFEAQAPGYWTHRDIYDDWVNGKAGDDGDDGDDGDGDGEEVAPEDES